MKIKLIGIIFLGLPLLAATADEIKIEAANLKVADEIPGWDVFEYVRDGSVTLETLGDDKALKVATDPEGKGLMLITTEKIVCEEGGHISFGFSVAGKGTLMGGAYLFDDKGKRIGGVYGAGKKVEHGDDWSDFIDEKEIPTEYDGVPVSRIQPYLNVRPGSEVSLKSLQYDISSP